MRRQILYSALLIALTSALLVGVPLGVAATHLAHSVSRGGGAARLDDRYVWLLVAALTVGAVVASMAVARWHGKRLVRPLEHLVEAAESLGSGTARPQRLRCGISEIDDVAQVLDRSAERIAQLLNAERQFAADASHQLRTPLTALSIRLEEIVATTTQADVRDEATAALAACERLTTVVDTLLSQHGRGSRESVELVSVDDVLFAQRVEWHPAFQRADREVVLRGERGLKARITAPVLSQVVATLIDNALAHGRGTVSLRTRSSGGHVVVEVTDEGLGIADVLVPHIFERSFSGSTSTGLGLSLARDLIEAEGGRLELIASRPPVFAIFLKPDAD